MLGWLAYNIKRALGIEVADDAEILLGKQEVEKSNPGAERISGEKSG